VSKPGLEPNTSRAQFYRPKLWHAEFEVPTAVLTKKFLVSCDITPCSPLKKQTTFRRNKLPPSSMLNNKSCKLCLLPASHCYLAYSSTSKMKATCSSETSVEFFSNVLFILDAISRESWRHLQHSCGTGLERRVTVFLYMNESFGSFTSFTRRLMTALR
jgi:hypothetical protein